ncbi:hypothetical protein ACFZDK_49400 [Streptomyces sp. NPDC007901]|uniref:hypothetical protein n=1 Tax=Streptomyces sp. NPDC007901 TaxID=3364785 RepID=UPI0036EF82D4
MEPIPYALTGYLDRGVVSCTRPGTAAWRLTSSPHDCTEEQEAIIPCTTSDPALADRVLRCQTGDLLRVSGHLTLPDTADGYIRLDVDTLEVLWEVALELEQPLPEEDDAEPDAPETADHSGRPAAVQALAEALTALPHQPGDQPGIRLVIGPVDDNALDLTHGHIIDITPATTHELARAVTAMTAMLASLPPQDAISLDPLTIAELTDYFDDLDLTELTRAVLDETRPEDRLAVTRALDDLFGDIPVTGIDDNDQ